MQTLESLGLLGLFWICLLSSSLYPLGSEVFVAFFATLDYPLILVWSVSTLGNTLGSLSTYAVGRIGDNFILGKYFSKDKEAKGEVMKEQGKDKEGLRKYQKCLNFVRKYGFIGAFLSFLPFLGDLFALALGAVKYPFWKATLFIALGKGMRYFLLIYATQNLFK